MKFWEESKKKYNSDEDLLKLKKKNDSIFKDLDKLLIMTTGINFSSIPKEVLEKTLEAVIEKIATVEDEDLFHLFDRVVVILQKRIEKKWEEELIELLKNLRIEKGYSQNKLAKMAGVSNGYIWRYENGERNNLSLSKLKNLTDALEVSIPWLTSQVMGLKPKVEENLFLTFEETLMIGDFIHEDTKEHYSSIEKAKIINLIKTIDALKVSNDLPLSTLNDLEKAFKEYKK